MKSGLDILISHPTGNSFVRALLDGCLRHALEFQFRTTLAFQSGSWWNRAVPKPILEQLLRRSFPVPAARVRTRPTRELLRLLLTKLGIRRLVRNPQGPCSFEVVCRDLDQSVARFLAGAPSTRTERVIYAYEDCAAASFSVAAAQGIRRVYELPIAYYETSNQLLREEGERYPNWKPTLSQPDGSQARLDRKQQEIELAQTVICPSDFVLRSIPPGIRSQRRCLVAPFGSPAIPELEENQERTPGRSLRVLFAGTLSQRKGLADLFAAMKLAGRTDVELILMGSAMLPLEFYRKEYASFRYEPPRPHAQVLRLMRQCDLLVLPSIVEGRALVQQEALSCGLPLITTPNAGGEDLIEPGETGFLVPVRSPEAVAEKIHWFADHRKQLPEMRRLAQAKARGYTWTGYADRILACLSPRSATSPG